MSEMVTRKGPLQCPICFDVQPYRNCARNDCALQSLSQEAVRDEALEEAAKACERHLYGTEEFHHGVRTCIEAIVALKREPNAAGGASDD